jgi:hypothetical protein
MFYTDQSENPSIRIDLEENQLIELVRSEARNQRILFSTVENATYHMAAHPISDLAEYVRQANQLIANQRANYEIRPLRDGIDVEFNLGDEEIVIIIVKNGRIILKTYILKKKL